MLNAIGLANVGLARFLDEKVPLLRKMPCPVIVNVAGHSTDDYVKTVAAVAAVDCVSAIELNVSCPNVKDGLTFGTDPARLRGIVAEVKKVSGVKPLIVKLSPNVEDITRTAAAAVDGGADVLSLVNTFTAMAVDAEKRKPRLANVTGGLSRTGGQADRAAPGQPGVPQRDPSVQDADRRHGRRSKLAGRGRVCTGRGVGGGDRDRAFY